MKLHTVAPIASPVVTRAPASGPWADLARAVVAAVALGLCGAAAYAAGWTPRGLVVALFCAPLFVLGCRELAELVSVTDVLYALLTREPVVIADGAPTERETVRLIPVRSARPLVDGVAEEDLVDFVRAVVSSQDWTQRAWTGQRLPSGKVVDTAYHAALMRILTKAGIVEGYGERRRGRLTVTDADEALRRLNADVN